MKSYVTLPLASLGALAALSSFNVSAHGWVEFPSARQNTCYLDGGFWTNEIPNQACQAAYDESGLTLSCNVVRLLQTYRTTVTWHT